MLSLLINKKNNTNETIKKSTIQDPANLSEEDFQKSKLE
jgi:hypothetical protein